MTTKVLSVEIGQGITHVVEMDYEVKNPKIYNCFSFKTPEGVVADGIVKRNNAFTNLISMECRRRGITTTKIVYTITSSRIASRDVIIPMVKDRMIQNVVDANASEYFPVDMSQYHLVYTKLGTVKQQVNVDAKKDAKSEPDKKDAKAKGKGKKDLPSGPSDMLKLNLLAVPNDLTKSYFDFSTSIRLALRGLDYMGNSVYQATKSSFGKGLNVVIKIDTKSTLITMIENGQIALQRVISYGMADAVEMVLEKMIDSIEYDENETEEEREEKKVTYLDALTEMQNEQFIAPHFKDAPIKNGEKVSDLVRALREEVTNSFKYMVGNLGRVIDYYVSRHENVPIDSFTAIGGGADLKGMTELLSNELGLQIKPLNNIGGVVFTNGLEKKIKLGEYAACIGAGIHTQNLIPAGMEVQTDIKDSIMIPSLVGIGCIVLSLGLYAFGQLNYSHHVNKKNELQAEKNQLQKYDDLEKQYEEIVRTYNSIAAVYNNSSNTNSELVNFIEELEKKMPDTFMSTSFTSTSEQMIMTATVKDKPSAAWVIQQLRTFSTIGAISSSEFKEDEKNNNYVTFTVTATYKSAIEKAEREAAAKATTVAETSSQAAE